MPQLTVTAKGQVTLKKEALRHLGVKPGEKIQIDLLPNRKAEITAVSASNDWSAFFGSLHEPGRPALTIEEINEITQKGWAGEFDEDNG